MVKYINPRTGEEVKFVFGVDAVEHLELGLVVEESDWIANQHGKPAKAEVKPEAAKEEPKVEPKLPEVEPVAEAPAEEEGEEEAAKPKRKAPRRRSAE